MTAIAPTQCNPTLEQPEIGTMMTVHIRLCRALQFAALPAALVLSLTIVPTQRCVAQTQASAPTSAAALHDSDSDKTVRAGDESDNAPAKTAPASLDPGISPALAKQLAAMQAEIEELRAELKGRTSAAAAPPAPALAPTPTAAPAAGPEPKTVEAASLSAANGSPQVRSGLPEKPKPTDPFAYADWTWLNGNPRNKDAVWDSKFFTPEIRMDINYIQDLNHPKDDTLWDPLESTCRHASLSIL